MIPKRLDTITDQDINDLVHGAVPEGRSLDYKEILPGDKDSDRKEFLRDVASFANAEGGDLVFGIREKRDDGGQPSGLPEATVGCTVANLDAEIRKWESVIRTGIEPRVRVGFQAVPGFSLGPAIVARISKGWQGPHLVSVQTSVFFSRGNRGRFEMDHHQIRTAFLKADELPERLRRFRAERVAIIAAGDTPAPLMNGQRWVLHVLPIPNMIGEVALDLPAIAEDFARAELGLMGGFSWRFNLDGFVRYGGGDWDHREYYAQLFRDGAIELVRTCAATDDGKPFVPSADFEKYVVDGTKTYLSHPTLALRPPIVVMISVLGAKGGVVIRPSHPLGGDMTIQHDPLLLPEIIVDDLAGDVPRLLRPAFDVLWQAAGHKGSQNFDAAGNWRPPR